MRVLVIINKWWECDPALAAMLNDNARPPDSPWPCDLKPARMRPEVAKVPNFRPEPRAIFPYENFTVEVWCLSDLLESLSPVEQSSSEQKDKRLDRIFEFGEKPALVIAVGTASAPEAGVNWNGGVTVGTSVFMHDGYPNGSNPYSKLQLPEFDRLIESTISTTLFDQIKLMDVKSALSRFLPVPLNPSPTVCISIELKYVALGTINVTNTADYATRDPLTIQSFKEKVGASASPGSLETTHGLIRIHAEDSPFLFVSGIVNRFQEFRADVAPRQHAQNTAGAHNAGVVVSWMLSSLDKSGKLRRENSRVSVTQNMSSPNDLDTEKARMTYAWAVWEFHGRQRYSMFYYLLIIVGILINGYITVLKEKLFALLPALCLLGVFVCLAFFVIDFRNRKILYFADDSLQESERKLFAPVLDLHDGPMVRRNEEETGRWIFRCSKMKYWIAFIYGFIALGFLAALFDSIWLLVRHRHPFS